MHFGLVRSSVANNGIPQIPKLYDIIKCFFRNCERLVEKCDMNVTKRIIYNSTMLRQTEGATIVLL